MNCLTLHVLQRCPIFGRTWATLWKKSCLGPHIKYIVICHHKKKFHNVLNKFTILCWAAFIAIWATCSPRAEGWSEFFIFTPKFINLEPSLCQLLRIKHIGNILDSALLSHFIDNLSENPIDPLFKTYLVLPLLTSSIVTIWYKQAALMSWLQ